MRRFRFLITRTTPTCCGTSRLVQPARVFTLHGFAAEFARDLRDRGGGSLGVERGEPARINIACNSWSGKRTRLACTSRSLPRKQLGEVRDEVGASGMQGVSAPQSEFFVFTQVGEAIAAKPAKLEKVRLLAEYLRNCSHLSSFPIAATYFTGKAFPQSDLRTLQAGWAVIYRALAAATKLSDAELRRIARAHGSAGKSALEALEGRTNPKPFTLARISRTFH